jgi:hypothetical protein
MKNKQRRSCNFFPRPSVNYLFPHVCFACRKSFKRIYPEKDEVRKCPICGKICIPLSRNFKAPRKDDKEQWEKVEFLVNNGFRFFSHHKRADGSPIPIDTLEQAKEFIEKHFKKRLAKPASSRATKREGAKLAARKDRQHRIKKAEYKRVRDLTKLSKSPSKSTKG